jgi:hypothetical protein
MDSSPHAEHLAAARVGASFEPSGVPSQKAAAHIAALSLRSAPEVTRMAYPQRERLRKRAGTKRTTASHFDALREAMTAPAGTLAISRCLSSLFKTVVASLLPAAPSMEGAVQDASKPPP